MGEWIFVVDCLYIRVSERLVNWPAERCAVLDELGSKDSKVLRVRSFSPVTDLESQLRVFLNNHNATTALPD
jgi:hypothetical protein